MLGPITLALALLVFAPPQDGKTYRNPVIANPPRVHLADPTVLKSGGKYYLYPTESTAGGTSAYDAYISDDLVHWTLHGPVFRVPQGGLWAPDVFQDPAVGDGKVYLYYTADAPGDRGDLKVIGVAVGNSPLGPFEDKGVLYRNAIDAHLFRDPASGSLFLYFVNYDDGGAIHVVRMKDPLTPEGKSTRLFGASEPWETHGGNISEGPWMLVHDGRYYLMYSGSGAMEPEYAIGYATADSPMGPFTKYAGNPIAKAAGSVIGPGHHSVTTGPDGRLWMLYHQKLSRRRAFDRFVAIDPLWFDSEGVLHTRLSRGTDEPGPDAPLPP
jgi:beta-xylosidase